MSTSLYPPTATLLRPRNDDIGGRRIDTKSTRARRKQEDELLATRFVVIVNSRDTVFVGGTTVDTAVLCKANDDGLVDFLYANQWRNELTISAKLPIILKDIQNSSHLTED